ncbi:MAG: hypothetical protein CMH65_07290 [Nevskiales bacterium]|nr:hypothetical protein [Nevskiales bacterium]
MWAVTRLLRPSRVSGWLIDALAFAGMVSWMRLQAWSAGDMVWSLWISSLSVGAVCFVAAFLGLLVRSLVGDNLAAALRHAVVGAAVGLVTLLFLLRSGEALMLAAVIIAAGLALLALEVQATREAWLRVAVALVGGLFFLAFFSVHFGGFHAIHALFLNSFFPLVPEADRDPFAAFPVLIAAAGSQYLVMVVVALIVQWDDFSRPLNPAQGMFTPYVTVVKLHLTILAIGFLEAGGMAHWVNYLVLAVYFIPLGDLWHGLRPARDKATASPP